MHFLKIITGRSKKEAPSSSSLSTSSSSSSNSPTVRSDQNPAAKRRLQSCSAAQQQRLFVGAASSSSQHSPSQGKVVRMGAVNSAKVLQMLGADNLEETEEILSLMNQARLSVDSANECLTNSCDSSSSEEDEMDRKNVCSSPPPGSQHSFEESVRGGHGRPSQSRTAALNRASPLPNSPFQTYPLGDGEQKSALHTLPDISAAAAAAAQVSPRHNFFLNPQRSPHRDTFQTVHPLPTPPPSPRPSAIHRTMVVQQPPLSSSPAAALPLPKAKIEKSTLHQSSPAAQLPSLQGFEIGSAYANRKVGGKSRPSESRQQSHASTPLSSPPSPSLSHISVHRSPLPSPPRTPLQSPSRTPLHSPPRSPVSKSTLHSPWSLVHVPQCPRIWTKGQKLGQGSFGTVYEGLNQEDGSFFAVKISCQEDASREIQQEVAVLSQLSHPNIVRYLGSSIEDGCLCIFLELVRMGSLESILRKYKRLEENLISTYTRQILYGLEYLHQHNTIHRDIKCGNILVDVNGQVKLADFGVAKRVDLSLASSCKGTPLYMAPEVMKPSSTRASYDFSADIWSLGCTILEMADGKPPWSHLQGFGFFFEVSRGKLPPIPEHLSAEGRDFILKCLRLKPGDRPTASELLQHPFVANAPTAIPPVPWLSPTSPTGTSHQLLSWFHPSTSNSYAHANWLPSSTLSKTYNPQIIAGAQRTQALLYG